MLTLSVSADNIKTFMNKLLKDTTFDEFETKYVQIKTFVTYEINGFLHKNQSEELTEDANENIYSPWINLKPFVIGLIKGNKKPAAIKIIFTLNRAKTLDSFPNAKNLFLNIIYENEKIILTTSTVQANFELNNTLDKIWEDYIIELIREKNLPCSREI